MINKTLLSFKIIKYISFKFFFSNLINFNIKIFARWSLGSKIWLLMVLYYIKPNNFFVFLQKKIVWKNSNWEKS